MPSYVVTRKGGSVTTSVFSGGEKISSSTESLENYRSRGSGTSNRAISSGNDLIVEYNKNATSEVIGYDATDSQGNTTRYGGVPSKNYLEDLKPTATDAATGRPVAYYPSPQASQDFKPLGLTRREAPSRPASVISGGSSTPGYYPREKSGFETRASYAGGVLLTGVTNSLPVRAVANTVSAVRADPWGAAAFVGVSNPSAVVAGAKLARNAYEVSTVGRTVSSGLGGYGRVLETVGTRSATTAFSLNLVTSTATTYGAVKGVQFVGTQSTRLKGGDTYNLVSSGQGAAAYRAGMAEAESSSLASLKGKGYFLERGARMVPILDLAATDREAFNRGVSNYATANNLSASSALASARAYGGVRRAGFAAGLVSANTFSEIGGQAAFASKFSKGVAPISSTGPGVGKNLFKQGFSTIAPQGFIEGTSADLAYQLSEGRTPKTFKYGELAFTGAVGAASAGVLGGVIYSSSVTKPRLSNALSAGANIADPYEGVGDYVAGTARGVRTPGVVTGANTFSFVPDATSTPTTSQTLANTRTASRTPVFAPTFAPTNSFINTRVSSRSQVPLDTYAYVGTSTRTPVTAKTTLNTLTNTNTRTDTRVNTTVQTNTRTPVTTQTSVYTPGFGLPFFGGFGGSGSSGRLGGGQFKTYTPSLAGTVLNIRGRSSDKGLTGLTVRGI